MNNTPKRLNSQVLGDIGEQTVQLFFTKFKWTTDIIKSDYGEDIDCNVFIDNSRTNYHLRCQVKSTSKDSKYIARKKCGDYSVSVNTDTLRAWLTSFFPVLLIVYDNETECCFWCNPMEQILKKPSKLENEKTKINVSKTNKLDENAKALILDEVQQFYRKILRLEESIITCDVVPVLMPGYRIIPFHSYLNFLEKSDDLELTNSGNYIELLPSWMSILKRIDPSNYMISIQAMSKNTDLEIFIERIKSKFCNFKYLLKPDEWLSFIVSPIEIKSNNANWLNKLTYWDNYSYINENLINDFNYSFEMPLGFLKQISRRARSWDDFHFVDPLRDLVLQFWGSHEITPTIRSIDKTHGHNIKGQFILWICNKHELNKLAEVIHNNELSLLVLDDNTEEILVAITTPLFNPFIGLYSLPMDWDSFQNGNVRNKMHCNKLFDIIPGAEYVGEMPDYLKSIIDRHDNTQFKSALITELEYIPGVPLMLDERIIQVSRFQMVSPKTAHKIESKLKKIDPLQLKDFNIAFNLKDDSFGSYFIYELSISWCPELLKSSRQEFEEKEQNITKFFDDILPSKNNESHQLKNTYAILHIAGEIVFEK